eukprot:TRINITY_DN13562_c0_g1_i1.p1 TRINITY_DN13562_c0_g1~~TRINITY_DN13562_c0_g1_i1.p1  ORF type:complete len:1014 (+),score=321.53 TRINITY_DN13562_c0_g1_i1:37-3042(+)
MGCCQSDSLEPKSRSRSKRNDGPEPVMAPVFYSCPNAWCLEKVSISAWNEHKTSCDKKRRAVCFKCGKEIAQSDFDAHLIACDPEPCPKCGALVIKKLLDVTYCPVSYRTPHRPPPPATPEDAAIRIQKFFRGIRVTREWCAMIFRIVWLKMDKYDERGLFKSAIPADQDPNPVKKVSLLILQDKQANQQHDILEYPEDGLQHLSNSEKVEHIRALRELVAHKRIPINYVKKLLQAAKYRLTDIPNVQVITLADGECCVIVGDLHGQLPDFSRIIDDRGLPSDKLTYIFNGDVVDRGCNSCEVLCMVLAMFMAFPDRVYINRGNHESRACTEHYGCHQEVLAKYSESVYKLMLDVFNSMPLCAVVNDEYFVVHGGLPRYDIMIDEINNINRLQEIPTQPKNKLEQIFLDILWSDPDNEPWEPGLPDYEHNASRDAGCKWRLPLTKRFCSANKIKLIIRAHHVPHAGYERLHENLVTTVFSASNYSGIDANHGAIAVVMRRNYKLSIIYDTWKVYEPLSNSLLPPTPSSPSHPQSVPKTPSSGRALSQWLSAEKDVLRQLREKIFENRHMLMASFCEIDTTDRGTVWKTEWADIMSSLVGVEEMPWHFIRRYLAEVDPLTQRIPFARFVRRYNIPFQQQRFYEWLPHLVKWLGMQKKDNIGALFDSNTTHKGILYYTEFFELVTNKLGTLLHKDLVFMLYNAMDPNCTGYCSREEWVNLFAKHKDVGYMTSVKNWIGMWEVDMKQHIIWDMWLLQRFKKYLRRMSHGSAFRLLDKDRRGSISIDDLKVVIEKMSLTGEGQVNAQNKGLYGLAKDFRKQVVYRLGTHETPAYVAMLFGVEEEAVVKSMKSRGDKCAEIQIWPLSPKQLEVFHNRLDYDRDGEVTYHDFQMSFCVQDSCSVTQHLHDETSATNITYMHRDPKVSYRRIDGGRTANRESYQSYRSMDVTRHTDPSRESLRSLPDEPKWEASRTSFRAIDGSRNNSYQSFRSDPNRASYRSQDGTR